MTKTWSTFHLIRATHFADTSYSRHTSARHIEGQVARLSSRDTRRLQSRRTVLCGLPVDYARVVHCNKFALRTSHLSGVRTPERKHHATLSASPCLCSGYSLISPRRKVVAASNKLHSKAETVPLLITR